MDAGGGRDGVRGAAARQPGAETVGADGQAGQKQDDDEEGGPGTAPLVPAQSGAPAASMTGMRPPMPTMSSTSVTASAGSRRLTVVPVSWPRT